MNRCLPWASTLVTACPCEPLGPAVAPEAPVRRLDAVGHATLQDGADPVRARSGWCRLQAPLLVWSGPRRCPPEPAPSEVRLRGFLGEITLTSAEHRVPRGCRPAVRARTTRAVGRRRRRCDPANRLRARRRLPRREWDSRRWPGGRAARSGRARVAAAGRGGGARGLSPSTARPPASWPPTSRRSGRAAAAPRAAARALAPLFHPAMGFARWPVPRIDTVGDLAGSWGWNWACSSGSRTCAGSSGWRRRAVAPLPLQAVPRPPARRG